LSPSVFGGREEGTFKHERGIIYQITSIDTLRPKKAKKNLMGGGVREGEKNFEDEHAYCLNSCHEMSLRVWKRTIEKKSWGLTSKEKRHFEKVNGNEV